MLIRRFQIPGGAPIPQDEWSLGPSAELIDFIPAPLHTRDVVGRIVKQATSFAGTYGMGGPGFFGLDLGDDWLFVSLWGAADWMHLKGRCVRDIGSPELSALLEGCTITSLRVDRKSMSIGFDDRMVLMIDEDSSRRAPWPGTGMPRTLAPDEDLRDGVFLCPTVELWTGD